ncbi:protein crumbs homolog 3a [Sardina pilchardus]|uniref:protein crumbs homolog 3a n=1 Tax=Sardina pilchardus TaxID=27697 RepID=UPI002E0E381F
MTLGPDTTPHFGLVAGGVLLLFLKNSPARAGNATVTSSPFRNSNTSTTTSPQDVVVIVVPIVVLSLLAIIAAVLAYLFIVVRKKRQTEGTYRPSAEEQSGAHNVAVPDALKLPKEERLI